MKLLATILLVLSFDGFADEKTKNSELVFFFQNLINHDEFLSLVPNSNDIVTLIYVTEKCQVCRRFDKNPNLQEFIKKNNLAIVVGNKVWRTSRMSLLEFNWPDATNNIAFNDTGLRFMKKFKPNDQGEIFVMSSSKNLLYRGTSFAQAAKVLKKVYEK